MKLVHPELVNNYALVSGPAFYLMYSIAGIFMGILIDKYNRKNIITMIFAAWSLSTLLQGYTSIFPLFLAGRFLTGIFVSVCEPGLTALLGDYFPPKMRTTVNSILFTARSFGAALLPLTVILI